VKSCTEVVDWLAMEADLTDKRGRKEKEVLIEGITARVRHVELREEKVGIKKPLVG
jgi:hypothetical protein